MSEGANYCIIKALLHLSKKERMIECKKESSILSLHSIIESFVEEREMKEGLNVRMEEEIDYSIIKSLFEKMNEGRRE